MNPKSRHPAKFVTDRDGSTIPTFALLLTPMLAMVGGAVDIGQAVSQKMQMQQALDAATVAVCTRGNRTPEEVMRAYLDGSLSQFGRSLMPPADGTEGEGGGELLPASGEVRLDSASFDPTTNAISPRLVGHVDTNILKLFGMDRIELAVETSVKCGSKRLELALMLDVTGSMCWNNPYGGSTNTCNSSSTNNKLRTMKDAVNDVLDIFESNMAAGATKIGLVPFSEGVRPPSNMLADLTGNPSSSVSWQYWDGRRWRTRTYTRSDCVVERTGTQAFTDAPPANGQFLTRMYTSNGSCNPSQEVRPLTSDTQALRAAVEAYSGRGGTAGHLGTAWAWYLVSPQWAHLWPQSGIEPRNDDELTKAVILMTDGDYNTQYCSGVTDGIAPCWAQNGSSAYQAAQLCTAMKAQGVVVYTVGFQVPNAENYETPQVQLLKSCASDDSKWFFPYDGEQLRAAFTSIGNSLAAGQAGSAQIVN